MLGRDITGSLDIQIANPLEEEEFHSEFVTKLLERIEQAHVFDGVRHTDSEIWGQNRYHYYKLSWEKVEVGDEVCVLFLRW